MHTVSHSLAAGPVGTSISGPRQDPDTSVLGPATNTMGDLLLDLLVADKSLSDLLCTTGWLDDAVKVAPAGIFQPIGATRVHYQ